MAEARFRAYDAAALEPVVDAMARGALALLDGTPTTLLGMLRRGAPLADRLLARMRAHDARVDVARLDLQVKRYADDLHLLHPETALAAPVGANVAGHRVLVVDDVLYQGHSLWRVFEWLRGERAAFVHGIVLVDRCCTVLPVHADVAGLRLQVAPQDVIECGVPPYEADFAIDIRRSVAPGA
jgi:pyrimidine operon attenuation protein/uracil phosphoribosyltransferase